MTALILLMAGLLSAGCEKEEEVRLSTISVTVTMSSEYSSVPVGGIYVKLLNTQDNLKDSVMTSPAGLAVFENLPPGTYNISASKELTPAQVFDATGYNEEVTLNAVSDGVSPMPGEQRAVSLVMDGKPAGSLLIKQFYYSAGKVPQLPLLLLKDQFIEIYNNSDEVLYADGLYIAVLTPRAAGLASDQISQLPRDEFLYAEQVLRVPGSGQQYPIQPGESFVVAANGIDFTEGGQYSVTVDNSNADFEVNETAWLQERGFISNPVLNAPENPDVTDIEIVYFWASHGSFFYFNADGSSVAIFRSEQALTETVEDPLVPGYPYLKIPVSSVIDAVDFLYGENSAAHKRLPISLDASFNYIPGGSYKSGKSMMRKVVKTVGTREVLMDTNNSANDFVYGDVEQY